MRCEVQCRAAAAAAVAGHKHRLCSPVPSCLSPPTVTQAGAAERKPRRRLRSTAAAASLFSSDTPSRGTGSSSMKQGRSRSSGKKDRERERRGTKGSCGMRLLSPLLSHQLPPLLWTGEQRERKRYGEEQEARGRQTRRQQQHRPDRLTLSRCLSERERDRD